MNHLDSDYFVTCSKTGDQFAGRHILADFWDVEQILPFSEIYFLSGAIFLKLKLLEELLSDCLFIIHFPSSLVKDHHQSF